VYDIGMGINFEYRGFVGTFQYSPEDASFHGKILDITPTHQYLYDGKDRESTERGFQRSVDEYVVSCNVTRMYEDPAQLMTLTTKSPDRPFGLKPWFPW
jgi:predicted HicB family RNase H-like nuclease